MIIAMAAMDHSTHPCLREGSFTAWPKRKARDISDSGSSSPNLLCPQQLLVKKSSTANSVIGQDVDIRIIV